MTPKPWLWLLAGPNGAGKSSTYGRILARQMQVVSPDDFARQILPSAPQKAKLRAGRMTIGRISDLLKERSSFAVETTLSGELHLRVARQAKSERWNLGLVYVGLASPELAIKRVEERRRSGGHDVPAADVRRRYQRSLRNLPVIFALADEVLAFDNSFAKGQMKTVLVARRQRVLFKAPKLPVWMQAAMGSVLARRRKTPPR